MEGAPLHAGLNLQLRDLYGNKRGAKDVAAWQSSKVHVIVALKEVKAVKKRPTFKSDNLARTTCLDKSADAAIVVGNFFSRYPENCIESTAFPPNQMLDSRGTGPSYGPKFQAKEQPKLG